jgi:hypothetical protein
LAAALEEAIPYVRYSKYAHMSDLEGNESDKESVLTQAVSALNKAREQTAPPQASNPHRIDGLAKASGPGDALPKG